MDGVRVAFPDLAFRPGRPGCCRALKCRNFDAAMRMNRVPVVAGCGGRLCLDHVTGIFTKRGKIRVVEMGMRAAGPGCTFRRLNADLPRVFCQCRKIGISRMEILILGRRRASKVPGVSRRCRDKTGEQKQSRQKPAKHRKKRFEFSSDGALRPVHASFPIRA
ncbi:MAG: hypothetical protein U1E61_09250 [Bradyrhizobium sp.]